MNDPTVPVVDAIAHTPEPIAPVVYATVYGHFDSVDYERADSDLDVDPDTLLAATRARFDT